MNSSYSLFAIFCDDIRAELNGKISVMGVYTGEMYVPDFPIVLPKVCAFFELRLPPNLSSSLEANISVFKGTEKLNSITLTIPSSEQAPLAPHGKPFAYYRQNGGMEFPSMSFSEPTLLEIVAQIDGHSIVGGRLWVTRFPQINDPDCDTEVEN